MWSGGQKIDIDRINLNALKFIQAIKLRLVDGVRLWSLLPHFDLYPLIVAGFRVTTF